MDWAFRCLCSIQLSSLCLETICQRVHILECMQTLSLMQVLLLAIILTEFVATLVIASKSLLSFFQLPQVCRQRPTILSMQRSWHYEENISRHYFVKMLKHPAIRHLRRSRRLVSVLECNHHYSLVWLSNMQLTYIPAQSSSEHDWCTAMIWYPSSIINIHILLQVHCTIPVSCYTHLRGLLVNQDIPLIINGQWKAHCSNSSLHSQGCS